MVSWKDRASKKMLYEIQFNPDFLEKFKGIELICFIDPSYLPMVAPPRNWNSSGGGYFFNNKDDYLKRRLPFIKKSPFLKGHFSSDLSKTFNIINNLQRVPYKIELEYLDLLQTIIKEEDSLGLSPYELLKLADVLILPSAKTFVEKELEKARKAFEEVKGLHYSEKEYINRKYHYIKLTNKVKAFEQRFFVKGLYGKFLNLLSDIMPIYFPIDLDARSRNYPISFLAIQGEEMVRACFSFFHGVRITDRAVIQLRLYGASLFLSAKLDETDLFAFINESTDRILGFEERKNYVWILQNASKPLLFLRFCLEYRNFVKALEERKEFFTTLPIFYFEWYFELWKV